jgi:hypothetical protein
MVDKIEMARDTPLPDLSDAIQLYTQKARSFLHYEPLLRTSGYMLFDDQNYPEVARVIVKIKNERSKHYEWVPWEGYAPKFRGFFKKC